MSEIITESLSPIQHVAVIMDGNGRWAKKKNLPTIAGHKAGAEAARAITKCAIKNGISYLTLYTFSSENWKRSSDWISELFGLLKWYLENEIDELHKQNIRFQTIGDIAKLPENLQKLIRNAIEKTKNNTQLTVVLALSYSGRDEIVRAVNRIIKDVQDNTIDEIDAVRFADYLDTKGLPDPDLLIRTSGEQRLSNYLLWQVAYSEFIFEDVLWPDFNETLFEKALHAFNNRERRFGQ